MALHQALRPTINRLRARIGEIRGRSRPITAHNDKDGLMGCPLNTRRIMTASSSSRRPASCRADAHFPLWFSLTINANHWSLCPSPPQCRTVWYSGPASSWPVQGLTNTGVAERLDVSLSAVGKWRRRFLERGIEGLHDELRASTVQRVRVPLRLGRHGRVDLQQARTLICAYLRDMTLGARTAPVSSG